VLQVSPINVAQFQALLSTYHLVILKLDHTCDTEHYNLRAEYSRQTFRHGGVCIFVHEKLKFLNVTLNEVCKEQHLEVCAVKLQFPLGNMCILAIYRALVWKLVIFLKWLRCHFKISIQY
jgi:hypothetical protein